MTTRSEAEFPLVQVRERMRRGVALPVAVAETAREGSRPAAALLAAARSHADLVAAPGATRVCRGTSCEMRGAARIAEALAGHGPLRSVHCIGYCHRSPALLDAKGGVFVDAKPARIAADLGRSPPLPSAPRVGCLAPEPIVTRRIARGDFSQLSKARADGAYQTLGKALSLGREGVLREVERSGERGRGGAGFPTAV